MDTSTKPTPYLIECSDCKKNTFLTFSGYTRQLANTKKDGFWCPNCGSEENVTINEEHYQKLMGVLRRSFVV